MPQIASTSYAPAPAPAPAPSSDPRLRCRVSSEVEELQLLHEVYGWVPGSTHVRPTPEVRAQKELLLQNLSSMWASPADWVFHHVFGSLTKRGPDGKRTASRPEPGATRFARNPYPYAVPGGTEHWVFWMASPEAEWAEDRITAELGAAVDALGGGEFVWYPNPKMRCAARSRMHAALSWLHRLHSPLPRAHPWS